jgi:hypothetical protein
MKTKLRRRRLTVQWRNDAWAPRITAGSPSRNANRTTPLGIARSRLEIHVWDATNVVPFLNLESIQISSTPGASTSTKTKI